MSVMAIPSVASGPGGRERSAFAPARGDGLRHQALSACTLVAIDGDLGRYGAVAHLNLDRRPRAVERDLGRDASISYLNLHRRLRAVERDLGCDGAVPNLDLDRRLRAVERDLRCDCAVPDFNSDLARAYTADDLDLASDCCDQCVHC